MKWTEVIEAYVVSDVHKLEGKPCWVDHSGQMTHFLCAAVV